MKPLLTCYATLALVCTAATAQAQTFPAKLEPGQYTVGIDRPEGKRLFIAYIPKNYDPSRPTPVVLMLHGAGGKAEVAARKYGWCEKADKEKFLALFPEGTRFDSTKPDNLLLNPNLWNDGSGRGFVARRNTDDIGYLAAVLDEIARRCNVDPNRIYCTGFSNGASMTFRVGIELSGRIAAIAPVSGHCWIKNTAPKRPMSMLFIVGTADPLNPIDGGPAKNPWGKDVNKPAMIESVQTWLKLIDAADPKTLADTTAVKTLCYPGKSGQEVIYTTLANQGHEWPGQPRVLPEKLTGKSLDALNATDVIWDFFKSHPLKN